MFQIWAVLPCFYCDIINHFPTINVTNNDFCICKKGYHHLHTAAWFNMNVLLTDTVEQVCMLPSRLWWIQDDWNLQLNASIVYALVNALKSSSDISFYLAKFSPPTSPLQTLQKMGGFAKLSEWYKPFLKSKLHKFSSINVDFPRQRETNLWNKPGKRSLWSAS